MSKHLLLLALTALSVVGCAQKPVPTGKTEPLSGQTFSRHWATALTPAENAPITAVHVLDQYVFAYRADGTSSVMDRDSGRLLHVDTLKGGTVRIRKPVILKDRLVYPTTTYLEVFDRSGRYIPYPVRPSDDTSKPFSQELKYAIHSNAAASAKYIFLGGDYLNSGRLVEIDPTRPYTPEMWTMMAYPKASISSGPVLTKDTVFVATEAGVVSAVTIENREPVWSSLSNASFGAYAGVTADLVLDETGLYVASNDTKLYCLNARTGKVLWQYLSGQPLHDAPVTTKETVYQIVPEVGLAAIAKTGSDAKNTANRSPLWIAGDAVQFLASDDTYVYVATADHHIAAVSRKTGERKFISRRSDFTFFATNTTPDGMIYASDKYDRVYAVKPILQAGSVGEVVFVPVAQSVAAAR